MNIAEMLEGKRVCVCAGSGGVGKTTTSAAIALGVAAQGAKVAVVTIDPAKRLANALGLEELHNDPRRVEMPSTNGAKKMSAAAIWRASRAPGKTPGACTLTRGSRFDRPAAPAPRLSNQILRAECCPICTRSLTARTM